jgi:hypothetical protein
VVVAPVPAAVVVGVAVVVAAAVGDAGKKRV